MREKLSTYLPIFLLMLATIFLHFVNIKHSLHFANDEVDQLNIIHGIASGHFPKVGPPGSIPGTHHGAMYYYMYFPAALAGHFTPFSGAVTTLVLSIFSVALLWLVARSAWGSRSANLITAIYVFSYVVNVWGRWMWNPNTIPFFTILLLFLLMKRQWFWSVLTFIAMVQLHLSSLFLGLIFLPAILDIFFKKRLPMEDNTRLILYVLFGILGEIALRLTFHNNLYIHYFEALFVLVPLAIGFGLGLLKPLRLINIWLGVALSLYAAVNLYYLLPKVLGHEYDILLSCPEKNIYQGRAVDYVCNK